jgi:hypothetical protein
MTLVTTRFALLSTWCLTCGVVMAFFVDPETILVPKGASSTSSPGAPSSAACNRASPVAAQAGPSTELGDTQVQSVSSAGEVTIHLTNSGFVPSYVESTAGHPLTITLVNTGSRPHAFRIDHYTIDVCLLPGASTTVVIDQPDLGDFIYFSDAPGDEGMRGTLTFYI